MEKGEPVQNIASYSQPLEPVQKDNMVSMYQKSLRSKAPERSRRARTVAPSPSGVLQRSSASITNAVSELYVGLKRIQVIWLSHFIIQDIVWSYSKCYFTTFKNFGFTGFFLTPISYHKASYLLPAISFCLLKSIMKNKILEINIFFKKNSLWWGQSEKIGGVTILWEDKIKKRVTQGFFNFPEEGQHRE